MSQDPLRAWLATLPEPEIPRGEGVVTGAVRDAKGKPVSGVEVRLTFRVPRELEAKYAVAIPEEPDLAASVEHQAILSKWTIRSFRRAETDAAGEVRFDALPDDSVMMASPRRKGWKFAQVSGPTGFFPPGARVEWVGSEGGEVRVEVRNPDGSMADSATLRPGTGSVSWTSTRPVVTLPLGDQRLSATSGRWGLLESDAVEVSVAPGDATPLVVLALRSKPGIHGKVRFPRGLDRAQAEVHCLRVQPGADPEPQQVRQEGQRWPTNSGTGHEFAFRSLAPGRYALGVSQGRSEAGLLHMEIVEVGDSLLEHDLAPPPPDRSRSLVLRLLDPDGAPVRAATASAEYVEDGRGRASGSAANPQPDGTLTVLFETAYEGGRVVEADATRVPFRPEGSFRFLVRSEAWGAVSGEARVGPAPEATVRFAPPSSVAVAVEGYRGGPWHGRLRVMLEQRREGGGAVSYGSPEGTLDSEGRADFAAVQPGELEVVLRLGRSGRSTFEIARAPLSVQGAKVEAKVAFPELHRVRFTGATWYVNVKRRGEDRWIGSTDQPGADGVAVVDLPAGEYRAEQSGGSADFTLPGPTDVPLKGR